MSTTATVVQVVQVGLTLVMPTLVFGVIEGPELGWADPVTLGSLAASEVLLIAFIRYELRYPGWKPGCDVQSEQEDTYRVSPATAAPCARTTAASQRGVSPSGGRSSLSGAESF